MGSAESMFSIPQNRRASWIRPELLESDPEVQRLRAAGRLFAVEFRRRLASFYHRSPGRGGRVRVGGNLRAFSLDTGLAYSIVRNIRDGMRLPGEKILRVICEKLHWGTAAAVALMPGGKLPRRGRPPGSGSNYMNRPWTAGIRRFGEILREWLREKGGAELVERPDEFCIAVGISFAYYVRIGLGRQRTLPSFRVIMKMARWCRKKPHRLLSLKIISMLPADVRDEYLRRMLPGEAVDTRP